MRQKPKAEKQVFHGIVRHSRLLGVSHPYLWRVLHGQKNSPDLLRRYQELVDEEKATDGDPVREACAIVAHGVGAAEARLPELLAAKSKRERHAIRARLQKELGPDFKLALDIVVPAASRKSLVKIQAALLPFCADALFCQAKRTREFHHVAKAGVEAGSEGGQ